MGWAKVANKEEVKVATMEERKKGKGKQVQRGRDTRIFPDSATGSV